MESQKKILLELQKEQELLAEISSKMSSESSKLKSEMNDFLIAAVNKEENLAEMYQEVRRASREFASP